MKQIIFIQLLILLLACNGIYSLTGQTVISGSDHHEPHEDHHIDPETGKVIHKRVVRKDNFLFVTLKNLEIAIKKSEFLVLFVYGDWCQFSKQHHEVFKKFATYHKSIHSKLLFGSLHIAKKEQFEYAEVVSNPTIFLYHHGTLIRSFNFLKRSIKILQLRPKFLVAFEPFLISNINHEKHVQNILDQYERFLIFVSDKKIPMKDIENALTNKEDMKSVTELPFLDSEDKEIQTDSGVDTTPIPPHQVQVMANFLEMSDMRLDSHLKYFNLTNVEALQRFFPQHKIEAGHAYLYRKQDQSLLRMESLELKSMTNWFDIKSWLYHHLHPNVLPFPEPAKKRILKDHNMALFLFLHGRESIKSEGLSDNEEAEQALDLIADKYYK
jgi:hypothetical protein